MTPEIVPAFGLPQGPEWLVIMVVALLLFGKRLPEIMRGLGRSVHEFKSGMEDGPATAAPAATSAPEAPRIAAADPAAVPRDPGHG